MGYIYRHIRLDKNEPFYIGMGGFNKGEIEYTYKRAYSKYNRNKYWKNIIKKTEYKVEIILDDLTFEEACQKEKEFIKLYGRIDLCSGILVNMTDGGEGGNGRIMKNETKLKISQSQIGEKNHRWGKQTIHSEETKKKIGKASLNRNKGKVAWNKKSDEIINEVIYLSKTLTNKEISEKLSIGLTTVKRYKKIYKL